MTPQPATRTVALALLLLVSVSLCSGNFNEKAQSTQELSQVDEATDGQEDTHAEGAETEQEGEVEGGDEEESLETQSEMADAGLEDGGKGTDSEDSDSNKPSSIWEAFVQSVLMIFATEIGDKTFFIAAIMAMKHGRGAVLAGALSALWVMTVMSVGMGYALPQLLPRSFTHIMAAALFGYFGLKMLYEASKMPDGVSDELEEVEKELTGDDDVEEGLSLPQLSKGKVMWDAFALSFLAEWGDRSQIATIALGANQHPLGVVIGGCVGHAVCTSVAVQGGRMLATSISERTVSYVGGSLFLVFGIHELVWG